MNRENCDMLLIHDVLHAWLRLYYARPREVTREDQVNLQRQDKR